MLQCPPYFNPTIYHDSSYQQSIYYAFTTPRTLGQQSSDAMLLQPAEQRQWIVYPPCFHPPTTPTNMVSATPFLMMTVDETAAWIKTLGWYHRWQEAGTYAERVKRHGICARMLIKLNDKRLKFQLGMLNYGHRNSLRYAIWKLYPLYDECANERSSLQQETTDTVCYAQVETTDTECDAQAKVTPVSLSATSLRKFNEMEDYVMRPPVYVDALENPALRSEESDPSTSEDGFEFSQRSDSGKLSTSGSSIIRSNILSGSDIDVSDSYLPKLPQSRTRKPFIVQIKPVVSTSCLLKLPQSRTRKTGNVEMKSPMEDATVGDKCALNHTSRFKENVPKKKPYADHVRPDTRKPQIKANIVSSISLSSRSSCVRLLLNIVPNQATGIPSIINHFLKFNLVVKVQPLNARTYIVDFQSTADATSALHRCSQIGYNLEPYVNKKLWGKTRPTPKNPMKYRVLNFVTVRSGKSLRGARLGMHGKGKVLTINKIKGRRARVIEERGGIVTTLGWVSTYSEDGIALIEQING